MVSYDHYRTSFARVFCMRLKELYTMKNKYRSPQLSWDDLEPQALICDSYESGIDDYDLVEVDWNANS